MTTDFKELIIKNMPKIKPGQARINIKEMQDRRIQNKVNKPNRDKITLMSNKII